MSIPVFRSYCIPFDVQTFDCIIVSNCFVQRAHVIKQRIEQSYTSEGTSGLGGRPMQNVTGASG